MFGLFNFIDNSFRPRRALTPLGQMPILDDLIMKGESVGGGRS